MNFIDLRTVFLITGMMGGLMALVLLSIKRSYPASIKGLGEWSYSLVLLFLAGLLSAVRLPLPASLGIGLTNIMIWSALVIIAGIQVMRFVTTFTMPPAASNMDTSLPHLVFILGFAFSILMILLAHADAAMYRAKANGRDRVETG